MCLLSKGFKLYNNFVINPRTIVCIGVLTPPQKHPLLFLSKPPLNWQTVQAPSLGNPPSILVFLEPCPTLKFEFFSEPPKY